MSVSGLQQALGRVPSGLFILTAGSGARSTGMLASWVMQAGFDPPTVTVAVKQERYVADWLSEGEPFVLNLVGEGQAQFLKHFAKGFEPDEPAFEGLATKPCRRGIPILTEAVGHLECEPGEYIDSPDHRIFLARVVRGAFADGATPMVHIRKTGTHY